VCLHLFSDDPDAVSLYLSEHGVPIEVQTRRLRNSRDQQVDYPVLLFSADALSFDLTVLPHDALRQAPLDRSDERRMRRGTLTQVEILLAEDSHDVFEEKLSAALR
jgi:hypothetical protein